MYDGDTPPAANVLDDADEITRRWYDDGERPVAVDGDDVFGEFGSSKRFVQNPFDDAGKLKSDAIYKSGEFGYNYETDSLSRVESFSTDNLQITTRTARIPHDPNTPGKLPGDHAGHLAGDRFGGSGGLENLVSQSSEINLSKYKAIENQWARAISEGKSVQVDVRIKYSGSSTRPSGFDVWYAIDGMEYTRYLKN